MMLRQQGFIKQGLVVVCLFPAKIKWGELGVFTLFNISGGKMCPFV